MEGDISMTVRCNPDFNAAFVASNDFDAAMVATAATYVAKDMEEDWITGDALNLAVPPVYSSTVSSALPQNPITNIQFRLSRNPDCIAERKLRPLSLALPVC